MSEFTKNLIVLLLKGIATLPFGVIYGISDVLYVLLRYVVKYRDKVISENLACSFPEKSEKEINSVKNRFYRYLCDMSLESVKIYKMSSKQMEKRVSFKGTDLLNTYADEGKGAILLAYHYNNWEWGSFLQQKINHRFLMVYNKMRDNKPMDKFLSDSREKWGGKAVQMGRAAKVAFDYSIKEIPALLLLIADQSALETSQAWTEFLHREAPFFTGPMKIAMKTNQPIFFQHIRKVGRGRYEFEYSLLIEEPKKSNPNEILLSYVRKMEEMIHSEPEYYLWSHRKWKHKRPANVPLIK